MSKEKNQMTKRFYGNDGTAPPEAVPAYIEPDGDGVFIPVHAATREQILRDADRREAQGEHYDAMKLRAVAGTR